MKRTTLAILALIASSATAVAQDTTRTRDTTRATRRVAGGDVASGRFSTLAPNFGLSREQATELQQALSSMSCDPGPIDGVVGPRTRRAVSCARRQHNVPANDLEGLFRALNLSFATGTAAPARRDTMMRPDTTTRRDTTMRRDTMRDTTRRDTTIMRDTLRDTTRTRRDTLPPRRDTLRDTTRTRRDTTSATKPR